jgi:hypothetical protein
MVDEALSITQRSHRNRRIAFAQFTTEQAKELVMMIFRKAIAGDLDACKIILPYLYGKPDTPVSIAVSGSLSRPEMTREQMHEVAKSYLMAEARENAEDADII